MKRHTILLLTLSLSVIASPVIEGPPATATNTNDPEIKLDELSNEESVSTDTSQGNTEYTVDQDDKTEAGDQAIDIVIEDDALRLEMSQSERPVHFDNISEPETPVQFDEIPQPDTSLQFEAIPQVDSLFSFEKVLQPQSFINDEYSLTNYIYRNALASQIDSEILATAKGFAPIKLFKRKRPNRRRFAIRRKFNKYPYYRRFGYPYYVYYRPSSLRFY